MLRSATRQGFNGEPYVTSPNNMMIYTAKATTNATGAITFTLPVGGFTTIYSVNAQVIRDSASPTLACFAMVRSYNNAAVVVQCFESKGTPVLLLNVTVEGIELATTAVEVHLTVCGI